MAVSYNCLSLGLSFLFYILSTSVTLSSASSSYSSLIDKSNLSVVMIPLPFPGHTTSYVTIGQELVSRGHNVSFIIPQLIDDTRPREFCKKNGFQYIPCPINMSYIEFRFNATENLPVWKTLTKFLTKLEEIFTTLQHCITSTDQSNWDIVLIDSLLTAVYHPAVYCSINQSIPLVAMEVTVATMSSLFPQWTFPVGLLNYMSHDLNIWDRLKITTLQTLIKPFELYNKLQGLLTDPVCLSERYSNTLPSGHAIPFIIPSAIGFEFPRTTLPLMNHVGPLIPKVLDPLPSDLKEWLEARDPHSVVYISMGTMVISSNVMLSSFISGIPSNYSVLWVIDQLNWSILDESQQSTLLNDKRFLIKRSWIPQITVLSHPSIGMAILHGGAGGVHQALYFGIPIITIPVAVDQYAIAVRVHYWQVGIQLNHVTLTSQLIKDSILKIAAGKYREEAKKMSTILKNAGGLDKVVQLIEFYATVGYSHLVPSYIKYQWSWIQYYNVDVYCILLCIGAIWCYIMIKCSCRKCYCHSRKEKRE